MCHCDYYGYFDYWGQGTMVTISSASPAAPSLFPLVSSCWADESQDPVALGCLAKDFLPETIDFSWKDNTNTSITDGIKKFPSVLNTAGTYIATTQLSVTASEAQGVFYCTATYPSGKETIKVHQSCQPTTEPSMTIRPPARDQFLEPNKTSTIICSVKNLCNQAVTLKWLKEGVEVSSGIHTVAPVSSGRNGYTLISELTVSEKDWNNDRVYSCKVESKNFSDIRNTSKSFECGIIEDCFPEISAQLIPPNFADIYIRKSAILTCRVTNMQSTEGLNVIWTREDGTELKTSIGEQKVQSNGRFSVDATTSVCADEWERGDKYTCEVTHPELIFPLKKTLTKQPVTNSHAPSVYIFPPPTEQLALREAATVTCLVKSFNPPDLFIKWLSNGEELNASKYISTQPIQESSQPLLYFAYSTLQISEQEWNTGNTYTCLVGHEKLPLQVTQRTVDKSTVYLDGFVDAEEEDFYNLWTTASTFIILFLLSLFYSTTVTLIKVK
uniref:Immunoglobulin heavy constant mu n=1 Tax=Gopherus evgoodei TaxID=1825980 RepID=A0A8C4YTY8_9SAUR